MCGVSLDELLATPVTTLNAELIHPDDLDHMQAVIQSFVDRRPEPANRELRVVRRDGHIRQLIAAHTPMRYRGRPAWLIAYVDVSERLQAEAAYRTIFEHSVNGLAVVQGDRIKLANPAFATITGRSLDFLGATTLDVQSETIVHPDDIPEQRLRTRRYLDGLVDDVPNAFRILRPDGSVRHVVSLRADFPYLGEPARLVTFIDDTERWQAEQAYRTIFEESIDGMLLVQNDVVVMANRAVSGVLGRDTPLAGEPVAALVAELAEGEDADLMQTRIARWRSHGQVPPRVTYRIRRPDGTDGLLFVQTSVVSHRGAPAALVAIVDLTDRWRAEEAYRAVFERSLEGLLVMSGTHVLMANRAAAELSGYAIDELTGLTRAELLARLMHADDRPILDAALRDAADDAAIRHELRLQHRDGSLRRVLATGAPMTFAGRPALLFSLIDLTERWQAEAALRDLNAALEARVAERTAALQATAQELEAFSYSASHDLRAPLRTIDGLCQAVLEDHAAILPDDATGLLRRVRAATANMATLIDQLMQLSRVVRSELRRQPVDLAAMAREVAADLARGDAGRQVSLTVADRLEASGDATLLRAVLANLLANAWKFTGPQPHPRVTVGVLHDNGRRAFFVRDNGVGFDPAQHERLFRPFQRLHPASEFSGHGIGLATVLRIVTRHGGRVWAESEVGKGATFYFTLE
jgi:PAS domain S-box-containing protein